MGKFQWEDEKVSEVEGKLTTEMTEIQGKLQTLKSQVTNLTTEGGGFYTPQGSPAFYSSYEQFDKGLNDVLQGLQGMSNFLKKTGEGVQAYDAQIKAGAA